MRIFSSNIPHFQSEGATYIAHGILSLKIHLRAYCSVDGLYCQMEAGTEKHDDQHEQAYLSDATHRHDEPQKIEEKWKIIW